MGEFYKMIKSLETLATECALERLSGKSLRYAVGLLKNLRKAPENLVVEYAATFKSFKFSIYGFVGTQITLMLNFPNLELLMQFVDTARQWDARWVLHESMNFVPLTSPVQASPKNLHWHSNETAESAVTSGVRHCKLRCFMCDEELTLPDEHLKAVKCDRFSFAVPLWAHC